MLILLALVLQEPSRRSRVLLLAVAIVATAVLIPQLVPGQNVQRSLTLALRLNENLIVGNIQGQRVLTIKTRGQTTTMQFTLYLVPQGK